MKKKSNSVTDRDRIIKPGKARGPVHRDAKEVMAELVVKLSQKLEPQSTTAIEGKQRQQNMPGPNRDRLTVGADLGDKWSNYCIVDLDGEKLTEGELPTTQQDFAEFFQSLAAARVVMEVGTHSAWARDVVASCGHEVLVANPRQMEGPKRRKRKNDRIDAHKLAPVGRMDPQSLFSIEHRGVKVRQDLVAVRARNAAVAVRKDLINVTRGLVKSMGGRLPKCSSSSFPYKVEELLPAGVREVLLPLVRLCVWPHLYIGLVAEAGGLRGQPATTENHQDGRHDGAEVAGGERALYLGSVRTGYGFKALRATTERAGWEKCQEARRGGGGAKARGTVAQPLGERRGI